MDAPNEPSSNSDLRAIDFFRETHFFESNPLLDKSNEAEERNEDSKDETERSKNYGDIAASDDENVPVAYNGQDGDEQGTNRVANARRIALLSCHPHLHASTPGWVPNNDTSNAPSTDANSCLDENTRPTEATSFDAPTPGLLQHAPTSDVDSDDVALDEILEDDGSYVDEYEVVHSGGTPRGGNDVEDVSQARSKNPSDETSFDDLLPPPGLQQRASPTAKLTQAFKNLNISKVEDDEELLDAAEQPESSMDAMVSFDDVNPRNDSQMEVNLSQASNRSAVNRSNADALYALASQVGTVASQVGTVEKQNDDMIASLKAENADLMKDKEKIAARLATAEQKNEQLQKDKDSAAEELEQLQLDIEEKDEQIAILGQEREAAVSNLEAQLNEANQYIELLEQDKKTAMEKATGLEQQLAAEKEEHEEEMERVNQAIIVNSDGENMAPPTFRQMQVLAATGNQNHTLTYMPQQTTNDHSTQYYSTNDYSTTTTNINNGVSLEVLQGTLKGMLQELSRTINQNTHQVVQGSAQQTHQEIKDATRETKRHVQILSGRKPAAEGRRVSSLGSIHTPKNFESLYSGDVLSCRKFGQSSPQYG